MAIATLTQWPAPDEINQSPGICYSLLSLSLAQAETDPVIIKPSESNGVSPLGHKEEAYLRRKMRLADDSAVMRSIRTYSGEAGRPKAIISADDLDGVVHLYGALPLAWLRPPPMCRQQ